MQIGREYAGIGEHMDAALITFSSSTSANRLKKLALKEQLYNINLMQTPRAISQNGCTYSIKCPLNQLSDLLQLADHYHVAHGYVYRETRDVEGRKFYQKL